MRDKETIDRKDAITALAKYEMSVKESRADILQHLHANFKWTGDLTQQITYSWDESLLKLTPDAEPDIIFQHVVSAGLSDVFVRGEFGDIMTTHYDQILLEYTMRDYQTWDNDQLLEELLSIGNKDVRITGTLKQYACPCCGKNTLTERQAWEICAVCWWEDDGTDNTSASLYFSGPNNGLQLTAARIHFIRHRIYNPDRKDLLEKPSCAPEYEQGRIFELDEKKNIIVEHGTNWFAPLEPPHLKENEQSPSLRIYGANVETFNDKE